MRQKLFFFLVVAILFLSFCSPKRGVKSEPAREREKEREIINMRPIRENILQTGMASWYGKDFHGKRTANGEIFDMNKLTAAHKELPFNTIVEVENLENHKKVIVRINDRGPFIKERIIDLSYKAARRIGFEKKGTAMVSLRLINPQDIKITNYGESISNMPPDNFKEDKDAWYYIQAGAFSNESNARMMLQRLGMALPAIPFRIYFQDDLFKVISEQFFPRSKAEYLKRSLENDGIEVFIKKR